MSNFDDAMQTLLQGTSMHLVSDVSHGVMHDRDKVRTPIPQLNCILGGGVPLGIILEAYGEPAAGKSTTWYQTMGNFQREYPEGFSFVVDTEASVDSQRMAELGCDPDRTLRIPATSIEEGFSTVFDALDKLDKLDEDKEEKYPVFIIWDTIGIGVTEKQLDSNDQFADGMLAKAKTLKFELSSFLPRLEHRPMAIILLNQVTTKMTKFGSSLTSGGGWGIKHNAHLRLKYTLDKEIKDGVYFIGTKSKVELEKTKLSPKFSDLTVYMDARQGGKVDEVRTMVEFAIDQVGYITMKGRGWYNFTKLAELNPEYADALEAYGPDKSRRLDDIIEFFRDNEVLFLLLEYTYCKENADKYSTLAERCHDYMVSLDVEISKTLKRNPPIEYERELDVSTDSGEDVPIVTENVDAID